ncbi:hypothetical protein [Micromonospora sp. NPDC051141]|uniref:hypothetical protein n=1 Tax=Micromonospora sp. NPDC051141 TaxID=3364284 RepID=UPI0037B32276
MKRFSVNAIVFNNSPLGDDTKYYIERVDLKAGAGPVLESCKLGWIKPGEVTNCTLHPPGGITYATAIWFEPPNATPGMVEMTVNNPT